ncbi:zf-HC2 domain-containing protein [Paramaledivibacter caminithermalis]|uniref:Putative zinc-finger n=1 Tax=Paramaledivibacter caminithermalis (strain DSM 15212 / CIP 107654 / DViRD3) TaxID=1121301 RepID=A0A1M6K294_PARC5|nr:zf-HC2 domain-containing protein [Paramaledivibacter caminithermalis]SHJ53073.1 Putative zinc-finger [Paramaledivibacter caminithermalis DSM 15212]
MKCSVVLDLLPLYEEGVCSDITKELVIEHLKECKECRSIYNDMKISINYEIMKERNRLDSYSQENNREFWYKYYKRLFKKGIALYVGIYFALVLLGLIMSRL